MADILDLLVEVSPSLKAGWILWLSSGLALVTWFWLSRATELRAASAPAPSQVVQSPVSRKDPPDPGRYPGGLPATPSAVSEPTIEQPVRPSKKSRSLRRKT